MRQPGVGRAAHHVGALALSSRSQLAVKTALAAALSWIAAEAVTRLFGGVDDYLYYAPLGAVAATHPTVVATLRSTGESVLALFLGGGLGLLVHRTMEPGLVSLTLAVLVGVALGAVPWLGSQRSWVPTVALLVLIIGGSRPVTYAAAYVGLAALGALCGVLVNVLMPSLPLQRGEDALDRLRGLLASQLTEVAQGLRSQSPPGLDGWRRRRRALDVEVRRTRDAVQELLQAQRGNPRARFHRRDVRRQDLVADVLERVGILLHDLMAILNTTHRDDLETTPLDLELSHTIAAALDRLAELVRGYDLDLSPDDSRVRLAEAAMQALTTEFDRRRDLEPDDLAVLGAVVANLRWATAAVRPEE